MKNLISVIFISISIAGCSTIISSSREEPIREDLGNRTLGNFIEDEIIEVKVQVNLKKGSAPLADAHINVTSFNGQVLLTGEVPNQATKEEATTVARYIREVKKVHNELEIAGPTSAIVRTNDTYLTSRVKLTLLNDPAVEGTRIKVVTENGVVFLLGLVNQTEAEQATRLISTIPGVRRIVKLFEYI